MMCDPYQADPDCNPFPSMDDLPNDGEAESTDESDDPPEDDAPFEKTYLAIDGIEHDDISDADKERLERQVTDFLLTNGYAISGVRILSEEVNVVELE